MIILYSVTCYCNELDDDRDHDVAGCAEDSIANRTVALPLAEPASRTARVLPSVHM